MVGFGSFTREIQQKSIVDPYVTHSELSEHCVWTTTTDDDADATPTKRTATSATALWGTGGGATVLCSITAIAATGIPASRFPFG